MLCKLTTCNDLCLRYFEIVGEVRVGEVDGQYRLVVPVASECTEYYFTLLTA